MFLTPGPAEARVATTGPVAYAAAAGQHEHGHGHRCTKIRATGVGQDLGNNSTTADISVRGVLVGTTAATFSIVGVDDGVASFTGPIIFTSDLGTLTAEVTGTLDTATGGFVSRSTSVSGTGGYAGVTGRLTFRGTEDLTTGAFTEKITGKLCAARS